MFTSDQQYIRQLLLLPGQLWGKKIPDASMADLVTDVFQAFEIFKDSKIGPDGLVEVWEYHGLLGPEPLGYVSNRAVPDDIEPHRCGGKFVTNDIDLAFQLFRESQPEFMAAIEKHGIGELFWAVGSWSQKTAALDSLADLNNFFLSLLNIQVQSAQRIGKEMFDELRKRDRKKHERAATARAGKVEKMKRDREAGKDTASRCSRAAYDYYLAKPDAERETMAAYVASHLCMSPKTVMKYSGGTKKAALKELAARAKTRR